MFNSAIKVMAKHSGWASRPR